MSWSGCYVAVVDDEALSHYGVLGMKWGVRRYQKYGKGGYMPKDKVKAGKTKIAQGLYNKSFKKLNRIDKGVDKNRVKSAKKSEKSAREEIKSLRAEAHGNRRRAAKMKLKSSKDKYNSAKYNKRAEKGVVKGKNWAKNMQTYLKDIPAPELTDQQQMLSRKYDLDLKKKKK